MSECAQCGAPMQEGQDWCLQCGAGPGGRAGDLAGGPGWRTGAAILAATVLLIAGASVAAYAALTKPKPKPKPVAAVVKQQAVTPTPTTPGTTPPPSSAPEIPTTPAPAVPSMPAPAPAPAPKGSESSEPVFPPETKTGSSTKPTEPAGPKEGAKEAPEEEGGSSSGPEPPSAILLDTNAASVYNPYGYPASLFGDPSLTIDGEAKTAWTAQVMPEKAPHMADGLLLDLKSPQKLGTATVKTSTKGASVEIYGANGATPPASITGPAWKRLIGLKKLKKKETSFKLKTGGKSFRYIALWLAKAPPGSTAAKPGKVAIGEFELFPPS